jgi:DNA-binding IclR family transcriptional regulator
LNKLPTVIDSLVGRAESADGLVRAEWTERDGLKSLYIDPKAMLHGVHVLENVVRDVAQMAMDDLEEQVREVFEAALNRDGSAVASGALKNGRDDTFSA